MMIINMIFFLLSRLRSSVDYSYAGVMLTATFGENVKAGEIVSIKVKIDPSFKKTFIAVVCSR